VHLDTGVEVQQHCFQRHSISSGRATTQCLRTFARMTASRRRAHTSRAAGGAPEQHSGGCLRQADAIVGSAKAGAVGMATKRKFASTRC
jgi:hypothetical protein